MLLYIFPIKDENGPCNQDYSSYYRTYRTRYQIRAFAALSKAEEGMFIDRIPSQEISENIAADSCDHYGCYQRRVYITADIGDQDEEGVKRDQLKEYDQNPGNVPEIKTFKRKAKLNTIENDFTDDRHNMKQDRQNTDGDQPGYNDGRSAAAGNDCPVNRPVRKIDPHIPCHKHAP